MARLSNRTTEFGKFLDSTLDRIADAAVFGSVVFSFAGPATRWLGMSTALFCLISGYRRQLLRARAESIRDGCASRTDGACRSTRVHGPDRSRLTGSTGGPGMGTARDRLVHDHHLLATSPCPCGAKLVAVTTS
ncbi:MAG: CDP-alcohol phosphatidyltransferase family protein [Marmoricola sp.]